jgi:hypothetical protein
MARIGRCLVVSVAFALTLGSGTAWAQENFDAGKNPAQLFANDCGGCHKSPSGLSKAPGMFGLESFLREHYTASRQAAATIAGYLKSVDAAEPPARASGKRRKGESRSKSADKPSKPAEGKPAEAKSAEPKSDAKSETKSDAKSEAKSDTKSDSKPAADKPPESKAEAKPAESKSSTDSKKTDKTD